MRRDKLLVLDFDGTLCLGDDPAVAYAAEVDKSLAAHGLDHNLPRPVAEIVADALAADQLLVEEITYDDVGTPHAVAADAVVETTADDPALKTAGPPVAWPLQDGYQLTQLLAQQAGLTAGETGRCFHQARRNLVEADLSSTDLHAPEGAAQLLAEMRDRVVVVLITNAPQEGFGAWLQALQLSDSFDAVVNDARKPAGMPHALQQARTMGKTPIEAADVLSIGDVWLNDLAHVSAEGGTTIQIDRFGNGLGDPDHWASSWDQAAQVIRHWADTPASA